MVETTELKKHLLLDNCLKNEFQKSGTNFISVSGLIEVLKSQPFIPIELIEKLKEINNDKK